VLDLPELPELPGWTPGAATAPLFAIVTIVAIRMIVATPASAATDL
jgi:hypothetical protein